MKDKVYTQMFSLLKTSPDGLLNALEVVARIGWDGIEAMGTNTGGLSRKDFRKYVEDLDLKIISFHSLQGEEDYAFAQEFGAKFTDVRLPHEAVTREDIVAACDKMNQQANLISKYGMKAVIHNHGNEFFELTDDMGTTCAYDLMLENTDPDLVGFEFDLGWAARAGVDVVDYIKKHAGRFPLLHVKECNKAGANHDEIDHFPKWIMELNSDKLVDGKVIKGAPGFTSEQKRLLDESRRWNVALGDGMLDWAAIRDAAEAQGIAAYINERENYDIPGGDNDPVKCNELDYKFLRAL
ncbi:sugar phosphate isomerase/epimerase [Ruminococcaceae bacterium OttesenSCG-928-D13]|nr:sugar phosphate isomerase/epimerase [Ruminococcaceae bacterium OttesenSCG-928-D13]